MYTKDEVKKASVDFFGGDELAANVFADKYAVCNSDGMYEEKTPVDMWNRMATAGASVEKDKAFWQKEFLRIFSDFKAVPQGSIMFSLGNKYSKSSCSNCFVLEIAEDSIDGIFNAAKDMANTYKFRGGCGIDLGILRPQNAKVSNAAKTSTGAASFMEFYSQITNIIGMHGRRGALMLTMPVTHPDILSFITAKHQKDKVTGANISVKITDDFMKAVEKGDDWGMSFKTKHENITKKIPARDLWKTIVESATNTAEPGLLFWDNIIKNSPSDCYADLGYKTSATNPCCLAKSKDVWVITKDGIKEIKQITSSDEIWVDSDKVWAKTSGYFDAGVADVYKVVFSNNEEIFITNNHKLEKLSSKRIGTRSRFLKSELVELKNLSIGDKVSVSINEVTGFRFGTNGTFEEGKILGWMTGDGCLSYHSEFSRYPDMILDFWKQEFDVADDLAKVMSNFGYKTEIQDLINNNNDVKRIRSGQFVKDFTNKYNFNIWKFKRGFNEFLFSASRDFLRGYLSTYFSADGTVNNSPNASNFNIQLASIEKDRLLQVKNILTLFGIKSSFGLARKAGFATFNGLVSKTQDCYRLTITGKNNLKKFSDNIGFACKYKNDKLISTISNYIIDNEDVAFNFVKIKSIEKFGTDSVGCIEVEGYHKFTANGLISGNSELPLENQGACTLLSMNVARYTKNDFKDNSFFDEKSFFNDVFVATRFLDNIKTIDADLVPLAGQKKHALESRRIGMGIHGLADTLANLGIKYDSNAGVDFIDKFFEKYTKCVYSASVELGKEKGAFPIFDAKREIGHPFLERIGFAGKARRNMACMTLAPTGSVSIISQTSSGIEPVFRNSYTRRVRYIDGKKLSDGQNIVTDSIGNKWIEYGVNHHNVSRFIKENPGVKLPDYFVTSDKIDWKKRVAIQSKITNWLDHSVSSTINLPKGTSSKLVSDIYFEAWRSGCKGMTVYVDGCRDGVLISGDVEESKKESKCSSDAAKRPKKLPCDLFKIQAEGQKWIVVVGKNNDKPYEVFAGRPTKMDIPDGEHAGYIEKDGNKDDGRGIYSLHVAGEKIVDLPSVLTDAQKSATRQISLSLRHGVPIKYIVQQLEKSDGSMASFEKAIARVLKKYIKDGEVENGSICNNCKQKTLVRQEGCVVCSSCGWTKCS